MNYLLMIMTDEAAEAALASSEVEAIVARHEALGRELRAAGKWLDARRLCFSRDATAIRLRDGGHVVTDGPFAESKEALGGFYLIEADSMEEAVEWAKRLPLREVGGVEVRPIWQS
jgi:hypothetical protein